MNVTVEYETDNVKVILEEYEWRELPWRKFEISLYKLQKRIYKASLRDDVPKLRKLQRLLLKSKAARFIAVRRVTQDNRGSKTAGVDGVKSLTPKQRFALVDKISLGTKVKPVRRIYIPKPGKDEKRPLGIPTMYDRAVQCLCKFALEPEWEAKFEANSYGFRPGRSAQDAVEAIFLAIRFKSKYVLDADISKCFDQIDHEKLLNKINTFPTLRRQIRAWLKAGHWDTDTKLVSRTTKGTPQGGVISPLLANIALHGMEECVKKFAETLDIKNINGNQVNKRDKRRTLSLIRYADDFVILHESHSVVQSCRELISEWLKEIGLELKPSKTRLTHTLHPVGKEQPGFDFLGFNIRQYKVGKYSSGKNTHGELLGFKTLIKPSKEKAKLHYRDLAEMIDKMKSVTQAALIGKLNESIRGWVNYYRSVVSNKTYSKLDNLLWWKLWKWGVKRHQKKGKKWLKSKYFQQEVVYDKEGNKVKDRDWIFATTKDGVINHRLLYHADTEIIRHVKVKGKASPYDGNSVYWSSRQGKHPEMPTRKAILLKKQKGKCNLCSLTFREGDILEVDHIIPKSQGGKDEYKNLQLLHAHFHDEKSRYDKSKECKFKPIKIDGWYWDENDLITFD